MKVKDIISQSLTAKLSTIILLVFSMIFSVACKMFGVLIIRKLVDNVLVTPFTEDPHLAFWVTSFVTTLLVWFALKALIKNKSVDLGTYVSTELSKAVHSAALRAELGELEKIDNQEIVRKISVDCTKIGEEYIGSSWVSFFSNLIFLIGVFITMLGINPALGLITYVTIPVFYMIIKTFGKFSERLSDKAKNEIQETYEEVSENFEKITSIKLKNGVLLEEENFQKYTERYIQLKKRIDGLTDIRKDKIFNLFVGGVIALILGIGGYLSTRGTAIPGSVVAFILLIPFVFSSFRKLMTPHIGFKNIAAELESIEEVLLLKSEIRAEPISSLEAVNNLRFENVSYYGPNGNLESLNFDLKTGEKLGIISLDDYSNDLIFNLILKIIRPKEGNILINNCDINKLNTFYLRDIVIGVPQEKVLFKGTIAENISYPLEFDEYKYNDALNRSRLKDYLFTLADKDQTIIDEDFEMTEEIMQRITFANAFYKDAKIFVLNEATRGVDIRNEEAILKELFKLKNKMIILMSNKTYNIVNCDKVLIIENEKVLEYGNVSELIRDRNSIFFKLTKKVKANKTTKVS